IISPLPPTSLPPLVHLFFFNATATPHIYTLSLHDALPISTRPFLITAATTSTPTRIRSIAGPSRTTASICLPGSRLPARSWTSRSEEHTSELQSLTNLVCRLLLEKKKENELDRHQVTQY